MEKRILTVGSPNIGGCTRVEWARMQDVNPTDFDVVVLDCTSLVDIEDGLHFRDEKERDTERARFRGFADRLARLLSSDGTVLIICPRDRVAKWTYVHSEGEQPRDDIFDYIGWFPFRIQTEKISGNVLTVKDNAWDIYFSQIARWDFCFNIDGKSLLANNQWTRLIPATPYARADIRPLAVTRADEQIGADIRIMFGKTEREAGRMRGRALLLPPPTSGDIQNAILNALNAIGVRVELEPPEWAQSIKIPGLEELASEIKQINVQVENLHQQLETLEKKSNELGRWRGLLFQTGYELQDICEEAFQALGAETKASDVSDEFIVIFDDKEMLVEIKGVAKSASKAHVAQLVIDASKREEDEFHRLALVVNAWRNEPVEQRGSHARPWFPENVIGFAAPGNVALISTLELLRALEGHWSTNVGSDILEKMFHTIGVFTVAA